MNTGADLELQQARRELQTAYRRERERGSTPEIRARIARAKNWVAHAKTAAEQPAKTP